MYLPFDVDRAFCGDSFCLFRERSGRRLIGVGQNRAGQCGLPYFDRPFVAEPVVGFDLDALDDTTPEERIVDVAPSIASSLVLTTRALYFLGNMLANRLPEGLMRDGEIQITCGAPVLLERLLPGLNVDQIEHIVHSRSRSALVLRDGRAVLFGGSVPGGDFPLQVYTPSDFEGLRVKLIAFGVESEFVYCNSE